MNPHLSLLSCILQVDLYSKTINYIVENENPTFPLEFVCIVRIRLGSTVVQTQGWSGQWIACEFLMDSLESPAPCAKSLWHTRGVLVLMIQVLGEPYPIANRSAGAQACPMLSNELAH